MSSEKTTVSLKNGIKVTVNDSVGMEFLKLFKKTLTEQEKTEKAWIENLKKQGVVFAHPNDGWISEKKNELIIGNPYFSLKAGLEINDLIAIGDPDNFYFARIVGEKELIMKAFLFKKVIKE